MDSSAPIGFFSSLKPGWIQTNREGEPENPAVLLDQSGMASRNKRKLDMVPIGNPSGSREKEKMEVGDTISSMDDPLGKGKAPMASMGPIPICSCCRKDINFCKVLAGEVVYDKERKVWSLVAPPSEVNGLQDKEKRLPQVDCPWCKKTFVNRYAVAAHSQFCSQKKEELAMDLERMSPAAPGRNFNLNLTPAEMWVAQNGRVKRCLRSSHQG